MHLGPGFFPYCFGCDTGVIGRNLHVLKFFVDHPLLTTMLGSNNELASIISSHLTLDRLTLSFLFTAFALAAPFSGLLIY